MAFRLFTIYHLRFTLFCCRRYLRGLFHLRAGMSFKGARGSKLTQLMAHHVFRNIDWQVALAVVHAKSQTNHVGSDSRTARPGLDYRRPVATSAHALDSLLNTLINKRSLFN